MKKVGIAYHPRIVAAENLSRQLNEFLPSLGVSSWICSSWEEVKVKSLLDGTDLVLSVGGDGTILKTFAKWKNIPINILMNQTCSYVLILHFPWPFYTFLNFREEYKICFTFHC